MNQQQFNRLFYVLSAMVLLEKLLVYFFFSIQYTDSDQTLLWQVATDLSNGVFHGPCFYGQSYGPNIEPLLAVPFMKFGMPVYAALPLVTILLSTIPFFLLAIYFKRKTNTQTALIPLLVCLLLPLEYSLLTAIPRGFVGGIFFVSLGIFCWKYFRNNLALVFAGLFIGLGLYGNLNSALLLPLIIPSIHWNKKFLTRAALFFGMGFIVGLVPFYLNHVFYQEHPELLIHVAPSVKLSWNSFIETLLRFNNYFDQVSPFFWRFGFISLLLFPLAIYFLWKKKKHVEAWSVTFILFAIVGSFFMEKTKESGYSLFFSGGRFFLAIPFVFVFISLYVYSFLSTKKKKKFNRIALTLAFISFGIKLFCFSPLLENAIDKEKAWYVHVVRIDELKKQCSEMKAFGENPSLLVAVTGDTPEQPVTYGCQCLQEDFPSTYIPHYERRRWLISEYNKTVFPTILLHGKDTTRWDRSKFGHLDIVKFSKEKGWMLVRNTETTDEFLFETGIVTPNK
ncbi:MAG: hypothetical protein RI989_151 [Bacteroidota bacterium]